MATAQRQRAVAVDQLFHALGDPTRRKILDRLGRGPQSVSRLAKPLGVTPTAIVHHLHVLEQSLLVRTAKEGRTRTCHIEPEGFLMLERWIRDQRALWESRLDRLGDILDEADD